MAAGSLGPWQPLGVDEVVRIFDGFPARWWISGGHALELHLGRSWRSHEDTDVSVLRQDSAALRELLVGWDIHVAAAGRLSPAAGSTVLTGASQNNLWCRVAPDQPWCLDVTIGDGDEECWIYRRDPAVRVRWDEAVLSSDRGIPYLAPELQLLFKSKEFRAKDDLDAHEVIPVLTGERRRRLHDLLPDDHPWRAVATTTRASGDSPDL
jgi:hypothetical protein